MAHLILGCVFAAAQEAETEKGGQEDGTEMQVTAPANLAVVHIETGDDGGLVAVPEMTLEELVRLRKLAQGVDSDAEMPEAAILSLTASGEAETNRVDLSVKLKIAIESETEDWVRIPLGLGQAVLKSPQNDASFDRQRVTVEELKKESVGIGAPREYVLWLRGTESGKVKEVTLEFWVPLSVSGREKRLLLSVPGAAKSELKLTVPMADVEADARGSGILDPPEAKGANATELVLRGFGGDIDLVWRRPSATGAEAAPELTSRDNIIIATVTRRSVKFEAKLKVNVQRPYGRELTSFEVRLPPGAVLSEETYSGYSVTDVSAPDQQAPETPTDASAPDQETPKTPTDEGATEGRLVRVDLAKPVNESGSTEVTLRATTDSAAAVGGRFLLSGFVVAGAISQTGTVVVCEQGEWDVRCDAGSGVEQVSEIPAGVSAEDVLASFKYFGQPFALAARVFPKRERISVEPGYKVTIEPETARIEATLKYSVRGNKAYQLKIDLNGWQFDGVGPEQVVIPDACEVDESGVLVINLREGMMVEFELTLLAHQPLDPADPHLELLLPKPHATSMRPTSLTILPADNVDLQVDPSGIVGLERQPASLISSEIEQKALDYRGDAAETGELRFAAMMTVHQQEISAEILTEVALAEEEAAVTQRLLYNVRYEPVSELTILLPETLGEYGTVEYSLDGEKVAAVDTGQRTPEGLVEHRIMFPGPKQGRFQVTATYKTRVPTLEPAASVYCTIPLIVPTGINVTGNRLEITVPDEIDVWGRGGPWREVTKNPAADRGAAVAEFAADAPPSEILIRVAQKDPDTVGSVAVQAAWIQTWMTERRRRDRVVFRFVSDRPHFGVSLPLETDVDSLRVVLDGKEVGIDGDDALCQVRSDQSSVSVVLELEQSPRKHVLELWYMVKSRPAPGKMQLELPRVTDNVSVRRCYWQLVLPGSEHVVSVPVDYTAEYEWAWSGAWWGRVPVKDQKALEMWAGASIPADPVPASTSRYLFSRYGMGASVKLRTAGRTWIVAGASGLALLIGLILIYIPAVRNPLFGLVMVIAIAGSTVLWPGATLLFAQAAGIGLVLSLLGAILYRGVARRRRRTVRRDLSSSFLERGSTQAQFGSSEVEVLHSTASEPDAAAIHAPEH